MQQRNPVLRHLQLFGDYFFQALDGYVAVYTDREASTSCRIDIQCDLR